VEFPSVPGPEVDLRCEVSTVELGLTGDAMVHGGELAAARQPDGTYSMAGWLAEVAPFLSEPDVMAANLETNVAGEDLEGYSGYPRFNSPPAILDELEAAGVDVLQTSNNHCLDRGEKGSERTLDQVDAHGFLHTGTYPDAADRADPWAMASLPGGVKVAFVSYTYGTEAPPPLSRWWRVAYIDQWRFAQDIANAKAAGADLVVVGLHWGLEYHDAPEAWQVEMARWLVANGADIVWGTHPHVIQPAEVWTVDGRDGLILYSLGNFLSNQRDPKRDGGMIVRITARHCADDDRTWLTDARFTPVWVDDHDADDRLAFRVVPAVASPVLCGGLSDDDCAKNLRYREHASRIFPAGRIDDRVARAPAPIAWRLDAGPRWFRYRP
jgi:poly-gamma-glutamate capsule biosynthesis protein CapA/YwtB (metallophosphatase superfamily)